MQVYDYPQFSLKAAISLFTEVENGPDIRKKIVEAAACQGEEGEALRDAVNFAFVDARLVSILHLCCTPSHFG
jgi:EKC/KEOPS complex subunit CGI121/TPRKB